LSRFEARDGRTRRSTMPSRFVRFSTSTIAGATRQESKICRLLGTMLRAIESPRKATLGRPARHLVGVAAHCSPHSSRAALAQTQHRAPFQPYGFSPRRLHRFPGTNSYPIRGCAPPLAVCSQGSRPAIRWRHSGPETRFTLVTQISVAEGQQGFRHNPEAGRKRSSCR
jgi:hypothetical protein